MQPSFLVDLLFSSQVQGSKNALPPLLHQLFLYFGNEQAIMTVSFTLRDVQRTKAPTSFLSSSLTTTASALQPHLYLHLALLLLPVLLLRMHPVVKASIFGTYPSFLLLGHLEQGLPFSRYSVNIRLVELN